MGQQEYDNFKRLIKEWLDNHPDEYADFVEEMNDKKFKGFFKVMLTAASFDDSKLSSMEQVNYIGAFDANNNWLEGWTEFDPQNADY